MFTSVAYALECIPNLNISFRLVLILLDISHSVRPLPWNCPAVEGLTYGVPQGSILGPLLFNLFVNDIRSCIEHIPDSNLLLFADDTAIIVKINK